jgi:hypothetical protein
MMNVIIDLAVHQERDPWAATVEAFSRNNRALEHTSVILIFRDAKNDVQSREIALHNPPQNALGIRFHFCGNLQCRPFPGDTTFKTKFGRERRKEKLRQICRKCGYKSPWKSVSDITWVHPITERFFWHDYPVTPVQFMTFAGGSIEED